MTDALILASVTDIVSAYIKTQGADIDLDKVIQFTKDIRTALSEGITND